MSKNNKSNLGNALIKSVKRSVKNKKKLIVDKSGLHTTEMKDGYDWGRLNLQSVTEESSLQEFMSTAELARTEFKAEKLNVQFITPYANSSNFSKEETEKLKKFHYDNKQVLRIPRRPAWDSQTTPSELDLKEKDSFLEWRRALSLFQESNNVVMTPFERTLEFWRQLWRVVERSDVVIQIVDARNPLLFRCEDLEAYVKEVSPHKINLLLVNKADFLNETQRKAWADYFTSINVEAIFYSATLVDEKKTISEEREGSPISSVENSDSEEEIEEAQNVIVSELEEKVKNLADNVERIADKLNGILGKFTEEENTDGEINKDGGNSINVPDDNLTNEENINDETSKCGDKSSNISNSSHIMSREELINLFRTIHTGPKVSEGKTTIGLVGYPNVGKSSTINSLLINKKCSTSSTPGKTKHFQTQFLEEDILLCDCPGLVMPSFVCTKADLVINGILPINQMRDHVPPVTLVANLIPKHVIEDKYNIMIPLNDDRCPTAEEVLNSYAYYRGFMTANGQPDNPRAARYILKDYMNGKLLYCHAPPNVAQETYQTFPGKQRALPKHIPARTIRAIKVDTREEDFERQQQGHGVYTKGRSNDLRNILESMEQGCSKPWKKINKHANKNKKEKLRRRFAHLDQH